MKDPYEILGVQRTADEAAIRAAYRKLAKTHHPDVNPDKPDAAARFGEISSAYDLLSDKDKRARFDRGDNRGNYFLARLTAFQVDIVAHNQLLEARDIRSAPPDLGVRREAKGRDLLVELQSDGIGLDRNQRTGEALLSRDFVGRRLSREDTDRAEPDAHQQWCSHVYILHRAPKMGLT